MIDAAATATTAREIVTTLASSSRFAGSVGEESAMKICRTLLEQRGFVVRDQPFGFSMAPSRWAPSVIALLSAAVIWFSAHFAVRYHIPWTGLGIAIAGLVILSFASYWIARHGVLSLSIDRASAVNLVATRASATQRPSVWLVAHIDSKSQTIPMIVRVVSATGFLIASTSVAAVVVAIAVFGSSPLLGSIATTMSYIAVVTALPIINCFIGNASRGALDNATGVASVILAAEKLGPDSDTGIIITSGEEVGLAGARHFVTLETEIGTAINCDTIDDDGKFICMASGAKIRRLDEAIDRAASRLGVETLGFSGRASRGSLRLRSMIPGILADNIAFTDAGWESFTLSRGNIATLGYVHTRRDVPERLEGTGIAKAASLIAAIVEELR